MGIFSIVYCCFLGAIFFQEGAVPSLVSLFLTLGLAGLFQGDNLESAIKVWLCSAAGMLAIYLATSWAPYDLEMVWQHAAALACVYMVGARRSVLTVVSFTLFLAAISWETGVKTGEGLSWTTSIYSFIGAVIVLAIPLVVCHGQSVRESSQPRDQF